MTCSIFSPDSIIASVVYPPMDVEVDYREVINVRHICFDVSCNSLNNEAI